ncbi:MAG TPA: DUF2247 family protein [Terriglobales bacterium]|nr:DUF2247 family protein [Terriglobales bacterium]
MDLIKFRIPAEFVLARVTPSASELAYGFHHGWLEPRDVVAIAVAKYDKRSPLQPAEEELALLVQQNLWRVDELVHRLESEDQISQEPAEKLWLFLSLAYLLDNSAAFSEPLRLVEGIYADFDYPEELQDFVRYMPLRAGDRPGPEGLLSRWRAYVERRSDHYKQRSA